VLEIWKGYKRMKDGYNMSKWMKDGYNMSKWMKDGYNMSKWMKNGPPQYPWTRSIYDDFSVELKGRREPMRARRWVMTGLVVEKRKGTSEGPGAWP
jgi:hypothetical protein